ncbi:hypothetical protein ACFSLT_07700 [Novosphingobium resinovorum]
METRILAAEGVIEIKVETTILIIMACLAFTTLVLKIVEMSRNK